MSTSLGRILFKIIPLWKGLISRHSVILPFALGTNIKLLHHLLASSTPSGTITCCHCSPYSSSFWVSYKVYASLLGGTSYG